MKRKYFINYWEENGKNYKIGSFVNYRCPTCGRRLH